MKIAYSQGIMVMITSRRMVWMGHVAHMGEMKNACKISLRGRDSGYGPVADYCKHSNGRLSFIMANF
jgi:hypothetical protein